MDRPRPLHWCDAGTPTPAGTCMVLLHRPTGLLSHSSRVHGALDPGSAFWIAAQSLCSGISAGKDCAMHIRIITEHDVEEFIRLRLEALTREPYAFGTCAGG